MAAASSFHSTMALRCVPSPCNHRPLVVHLRANLLLPRHPCRRPLVAFSRRRSKTISAITFSKKNQQMVPRNEIIKEDDVDEDALESTFSQQQEDLENDDPSLAELESELEEDLAELEREFEGLAKLERVLDKALRVLSDGNDGDSDDDDGDDTEEKIVKLPTNLQMMPYNVVTKEDDVGEDALEREFQEDLAKLECELDEALRALSDDDDDDEEEEDDNDNDDSDNDNDGGEQLVMLPKDLQRSNHNEVTKDDDADEDALEALFSQLEEDLENGDPYLDDGDGEIDEKGLAKLERELEEALGDDELLGVFDSLEDDEVNKKVEDDDDGDGDYNEDAEKQLVKLKNWQLRRLAYALKSGKRKISIKNLAADICLDRSVVLQLLRDPPPNLLLLSAALPNKPISPISKPASKIVETVPSEIVEDVALPETKVEEPVHVMQSSWSARKRLKKVQVDTLERVYARSKRPTNAMISSIVHVTNLPRKRVVKWFEDKRTEDGVPDHRGPYERSDPYALFNGSKK